MIFDCLDGDSDNCISIRAVNIEAVPRDITHILMPIIQELEDLEEGQGAIDKNEFVQASLRLYQVILNAFFFLTMTFLWLLPIDSQCR